MSRDIAEGARQAIYGARGASCRGAFYIFEHYALGRRGAEGRQGAAPIQQAGATGGRHGERACGSRGSR